MPRRRSLAAALAALTAAAGLAACAPEPVEPVELAAGSCVQHAWNSGPDRQAVVDCSAPHLFDAIASLGEWPGIQEAVEAEGSSAGAVYESIVRGDPDDPVGAQFRFWAEPRCERALLELLGLDAVAVGEQDGQELGLEVVAPYALVTALSSREQFERGDRTALCAVAWLDGAGGLSPVEFPPGATITALAGPGLPAGLRECFALAGDGARQAAPCDEPHTGQVVVDLDARPALGDEWVMGVDPATGRAEDYASADAMCQAVLEQLLPEGALTGDHKVWADIRPTDGWTRFDGLAVESERYPVSCAVIARKRGAALEGDLWGGLPEPTTPAPSPSGSAG